MTRRRWVPAAALAALVLPAGWGVLRSLRPASDVPEIVVAPGPFVRRILAEGNLAAVDATPVTAPMEAQEALKVSWIVQDGQRVAKDDVLVRFDPTDMEQKLVDGGADLATAHSRIDGLQAQSQGAIKNLDRDAGMARRELEYAGEFQQKDAEIFSRAAIIESEIDRDLASEKLRHAETVKGIRERLTGVDLDLLRIEGKKANLKIDQAKKGLAAMEVRAPHDGIVVLKRNWQGVKKVGDSVWPGEPIAEIPKLDAMQAEVYVLEADAGGLAVGQTATIALESHPDRTFAAKIKKVDAFAKRRVNWIPVQYFGVTLEIDKTLPELMKPGQRLRATIVLDEKSDALSLPRSAVFDKEGKKLVYRRNGRGYDPVEVTLGASAVGRVVVDKGLAAGDVVALRDPTRPAGASAPEGGTEAGPGAVR